MTAHLHLNWLKRTALYTINLHASFLYPTGSLWKGFGVTRSLTSNQHVPYSTRKLTRRMLELPVCWNSYSYVLAAFHTCVSFLSINELGHVCTFGVLYFIYKQVQEIGPYTSCNYVSELFWLSSDRETRKTFKNYSLERDRVVAFKPSRGLARRVFVESGCCN